MGGASAAEAFPAFGVFAAALDAPDRWTGAGASAEQVVGDSTVAIVTPALSV